MSAKSKQLSMTSNHPKFKDGGMVDYGTRHGSTAKKERGFLGEIRLPDGRDVMTEKSISVDGREIPSIVRGQHPADTNYIRETGNVPEDVIGTAVNSARRRMAEGKSPFWNAKQDQDKGK